MSWKGGEKSIHEYMRPKQSYQRLESSINKCINVVIPMHLDLLRKHASNIKKFKQLKEWNKVRQEHVNATRTVEQLKADLWSLDILRNQVVDDDLEKFHKIASKSQASVTATIEEFLANEIVTCDSSESQRLTSEIEDDQLSTTSTQNLEAAFAQIEERQILRNRIEQESITADSWEELRNNLQDLNQTLVMISNLVHSQHELVNRIEDNIESADKDVVSGTKHLAKARMYKAYMYPVAGALVGGCIGGPVGIFVGLKAGAAAIALGSLIGFTSGLTMKKKVKKTVEFEMNYLEQMRNDYSASFKSNSMPDMRIICNENEDGFINVSKLIKR